MESHTFYAPGSSSLNGISKRSFEWDLNDWKWDGELFIASPLNAVPAACRNKRVLFDAANGLPWNNSSSGSEEADFGLVERERGEAEKRRRVLVVEEEEPRDGTGSLSLKLGRHAYPVTDADAANRDANNGKKGKSQVSSSNRPTCQVEGCGADLSDSKDYHRRHKVCEMHAKASTARVGNAVQRFCQQCSRFHLLQEFDEGKRSCRRRLAGHNKRRRKAHPNVMVGGNSVIDERATSYLLISLLRILTNLHSDNSQQSKDQELLNHLLRNLAVAGSFDPSNLSRLLESSHDLQKDVNTVGTSKEAASASILDGFPAQESARPSSLTNKMTSITSTQASALKQSDQAVAVAPTTVEMPSKGIDASPETAVDIVRMKDFDLNNVYSEMQDSEDGLEKPETPAYNRTASPNCPSWLLHDSHQSSPLQMSSNSESTSAQSLTNSNGEAKCRTDRIIFKLFGKDPNNFPLDLRGQILDWLSHSPTDMESYIRPGCVVLTIYLRIPESAWEELCDDFGSSLNRLLHNSVDFWTRGWIFARIHNRITLIYNGQFVLDIPVLLGCPNHHTILSVKPIAVPHSTSVIFSVKGFNLARPTVRLLCSFEGKYLVQEETEAPADCPGTNADYLSQSLSFSCSLPNASGRGFFEVEDQGFSNGFFPFIVAEEDICSEVRMLENAIDVASLVSQPHEATEAENARNQALQFIHEFGWLLRKNQIRIRSGEVKSFPSVYSLARFRWLVAFSLNQNWPMVVKKLLDILFSGTVDLGKESPEEIALSEYLLQSAVRRNSRVMVELLLRYVPENTPKGRGALNFLFRPDMPGPSGITPLHIAASSSGAESVLDALTNDPIQLGIKAWRSSRDSTGFTPEDYARARGHDSYLWLVQKKINKLQEKVQVVFDITGDSSNKIADGPKFNKLTGFELNKSEFRIKQQPDCKRCSQQLAYQNPASRIFLYRPAMLSMLGIAAVCVCVGLLLKTPPRVCDVFPSFRWELLGSGPI